MLWIHWTNARICNSHHHVSVPPCRHILINCIHFRLSPLYPPFYLAVSLQFFQFTRRRKQQWTTNHELGYNFFCALSLFHDWHFMNVAIPFRCCMCRIEKKDLIVKTSMRKSRYAYLNTKKANENSVGIHIKFHSMRMRLMQWTEFFFFLALVNNAFLICVEIEIKTESASEKKHQAAMMCGCERQRHRCEWFLLF